VKLSLYSMQLGFSHKFLSPKNIQSISGQSAAMGKVTEDQKFNDIRVV